MTGLKQRFPFYGRTLRLYPSTYYRQYGMQTLQTLADIMDDPELSRAAKLKLHTAAWLDLGKSIPRQRLITAIRRASYQANTYFRNRGLLSALLLAPLVITLVDQLIFGTHSALPAQAGPFLRFWFGQSGVSVWALLLPLLASLNAFHALGIWFVARRKLPKAKRAVGSYHAAKLSLAVLWFIGVAGVGFLGFIIGMQYLSARELHHEQALSMAYQHQHPTLACTLLPLASARLISGAKSMYLDNNHMAGNPPFSGILTDADDIRRTTCDYHIAQDSQPGITVTTREAFSESARAHMHDDFSDQQGVDAGYNWQPFVVMNYQGYYGQEPGAFDLSIWVNGYWLKATAPSLDTATTTMQTMISNLAKELAARVAAKLPASSRQVLPLPVTKPSLSKTDQTTIEYALMLKNVHVPAGTELNAYISSMVDDQVSGTFRYSNGLHGTFVAQKKQSDWLIIGYKEDRK
ncbi:MAG TPA: hypothetical protein VLF69_04415 [Candidatus Saccharimonadales bacterium]|nr:hypothetical protein [Candidatus Saccharimonadales bacterium]